MTQSSRIVEPTRPGGPYIASIFDPQGRIVASHGFPLRAGAEKFLQAFMQEGAGEHGLALADETRDGRPA